MTLEGNMSLFEAEGFAAQVMKAIAPFASHAEVVGSIRRRRARVNDIDIILIPADDEAWKRIPRAVSDKLQASIIRRGNELLCFSLPDMSHKDEERGMFTGLFPRVQVDIYRATPETWGVLELIRTGSKEHNVKLCAYALTHQMMLSAAKGLTKNGEVIACRTEQEIFEKLGLPYVEPQDRI